LFGSVLTDHFRPDSDIDVLVKFEPGHTPGLAIFDIEDELSALFGGSMLDMARSACGDGRRQSRSIRCRREPPAGRRARPSGPSPSEASSATASRCTCAMGAI